MKQRVVGAIVLVALAVIFLPMLLDGSGRPERVDLEVEIPEQPEAPASRLQEDRAADAATEPAAQTDGASPASATTAQADPAATPADPGDAAATDDGGDGGGDAAADGGGTTDAAEGPSAWVVQVGSFAQETNALVLRDRLRQQGYDAFAEQGSSDGQVLWRVRVGPVPTRERAQSLKQRLEEQRDQAALVMSYP